MNRLALQITDARGLRNAMQYLYSKAADALIAFGGVELVLQEPKRTLDHNAKLWPMPCKGCCTKTTCS